MWQPAEPEIQAEHRHSFRVTIPARTARHQQATILATWTNGSPVLPRKDIFQIYGFRKLPDGWRCTATNGAGAEHYELAAEHPANESESR